MAPDMIEAPAVAPTPTLTIMAMTDLISDELRMKRLVNLTENGATDDDLADIFGLPAAAIVERLDSVLRKARAEHRMRIRKALLVAAEHKHEPSALLLLTKKYLEA